MSMYVMSMYMFVYAYDVCDVYDISGSCCVRDSVKTSGIQVEPTICHVPEKNCQYNTNQQKVK